ncbi:MAG: hypothetical protein M1823_005762 [Watsoniomyces obsoletus]|nr:MAG: hypothetical protein M1823_005762 [Watsoniomyces obsoletus]
MKIPKQWKTPRVITWLFTVEFLFTIPVLALFGIAAPNTFRTHLWKDGGRNEFNSDPNQILYAYANYRPLPKTPMVWSQFITNWNLAISLVSMFTLLIAAVLHIMHIFYPILSLLSHLVLTALYAVSIYGQAGPDRSDPRHPSSSPWYLTKSCSVAIEPRNEHYCNLAKATFAVTVVMLVIFLVHIPLAIYSLIPGKGSGKAEDANSVMSEHVEKPFEMNNVPSTPARTPFSPRTTAFNALSARA